jgi:hypothetical protein
MKNFLNFTIVVFIAGLAHYGCQSKKEIMTPTNLANIILKSVFDKDSTLFLDRLFNKERSLQTLKLGQLSDYVIEQETALVNNESEMKIYRDSMSFQYRELVRKFDSIGLKPFVFDTVDFNNYFNGKRPFYRLAVDGWIYHGQDTFVLKIRDAILLVDGWNLGSVELVRPDNSLKFIRNKDLRDSLEKIQNLEAEKRKTDTTHVQ